jgi:hypothetical protein
MISGKQTGTRKVISRNRVELHLSGLIGTARRSDTQKIWIIGFFFENRLHWQYEFRLLLFTVSDRLCGLVVRVSGYRYRGLGFDPRRYQIF